MPVVGVGTAHTDDGKVGIDLAGTGGKRLSNAGTGERVDRYVELRGSMPTRLR